MKDLLLLGIQVKVEEERIKARAPLFARLVQTGVQLSEVLESLKKRVPGLNLEGFIHFPNLLLTGVKEAVL